MNSLESRSHSTRNRRFVRFFALSLLTVLVAVPIWPGKSEAADLTLRLTLANSNLTPGDTFALDALVINPGPERQGVLVVALEAGGNFYFWPSGGQAPAQEDYMEVNLRAGWNRLNVIPSFTWRETGTSGSNLTFYAVVLSPDLQDAVSTVGSAAFSFYTTFKGYTASPEAFYKTGQVGANRWMLPNGRMINPKGRLALVDALPLGIAISPDGRYAVTNQCGQGQNSLAVIDLATGAVLNTSEQKGLFVGLSFSPDGSYVYASGTYSVTGSDPQDGVMVFRFQGQRLSLKAKYPVKGFPAGLCLSPDGTLLFVVTQSSGELVVLDAATGEALFQGAAGQNPFFVVHHPSKPEIYVSLQGGEAVVAFDVSTPQIPTKVKEIPVQKNPEGMTLDTDGSTLYVSNADEDSVSIINTATYKVTKTLDLRPTVSNAYGSTPNSVAFSPAEGRLYVAQASDNRVLVIELASGRTIGAIPTAWYPTAVALTPDEKTLVVANGKGVGTSQYAPLGLKNLGIIQVVGIPGDAELRTWYEESKVNGSLPGKTFTPDSGRWTNPIPLERGGKTPIKYVFMVVRENKTYDCLMGDYAKGDGNPSNCLWCYDETPNLHALYDQFAGGDNYYVNSDASNQGHQLLTSSTVNSWLEKIWPTHSSTPILEVEMFLNKVAWPKKEYIFQNLLDQGIKFYVHGEMIGMGIDGLFLNPEYMHSGPIDWPFYNMLTLDVDKLKERIETWEKMDPFPQYVFMLFPNDHGAGSFPYQTKRSAIADTDLATGQFVEWLSHSKYWEESVAFIVEDDSQDGEDKVDLHRSILSVVSPYTKRGYVSPIHYCEANIHSTVEHILNLPPMTIYDEMAQPMWDLFTDKPDFTPYTALPRKFDVEYNQAATAMTEASRNMNFAEPDEAEGWPQLFLNRPKGEISELAQKQIADYERSKDAWPDAWRQVFIEVTR